MDTQVVQASPEDAAEMYDFIASASEGWTAAKAWRTKPKGRE